MDRYIVVAGNIGTGKTSLVDYLARKYPLRPVFEPNESNPYLDDFYRDMKRWAFHSQVFFLIRKYRLHRELERETASVIQDRSIYEDAEIFARHLYRSRKMSKREFSTYWELYETFRQDLRPPDVLIYLHCSVRALRRRIRIRGRPMEQNLPSRYLRRLNDLYERWIGDYDLSPVIRIPTDRMDYVTDLLDRHAVLKAIEEYLP